MFHFFRQPPREPDAPHGNCDFLIEKLLGEIEQERRFTRDLVRTIVAIQQPQAFQSLTSAELQALSLGRPLPPPTPARPANEQPGEIDFSGAPAAPEVNR